MAASRPRHVLPSGSLHRARPRGSCGVHTLSSATQPLPQNLPLPRPPPPLSRIHPLSTLLTHHPSSLPRCCCTLSQITPGAEYGGHDLLVLNSRDGTPYACPFEPITLPLGGVAAQSHAYLGGGATKRSGEVTLTLPREEGEWSVRLLRLTRNDSHFATTTSIEGCSDLRWPWWDAANATTMVYDLVASFGT